MSDLEAIDGLGIESKFGLRTRLGDFSEPRIESRCCFECGRRRGRWAKLAADADYPSIARLTLASAMVDRIRFARGRSSLRVHAVITAMLTGARDMYCRLEPGRWATRREFRAFVEWRVRS